MSELFELIDLFENYFEKEKIYTNTEIKSFFQDNSIGKNSRNPGSFTYNRINDGTNYFLPLFNWLGPNQYSYLGPNHAFNGILSHYAQNQEKSNQIGAWENGNLTLTGSATNQLDLNSIEERIYSIKAYGVLNALRQLVEAKNNLRRLDAIRSERLTGEIGEWYAEILTGGIRARTSSQTGWDLQLQDKKIQVKTHAKGENNNARWTEWKYNDKVFDELVIVVLSNTYLIKEAYRMSFDEAFKKVNTENKQKVLKWNDCAEHLIEDYPPLLMAFLHN